MSIVGSPGRRAKSGAAFLLLAVTLVTLPSGLRADADAAVDEPVFIQHYPAPFIQSKGIPAEFLEGDPAQWRHAIEKTKAIYADVLQGGYTSEEEPYYGALMALNYAPTKNNRMRLLVGRDYWNRLIPLIRTAQKSIDIMIYGWQTNETWPITSWNPKYGGEFLEDEICPAVRRGVHVNLIVSNPKYSVWGSPFTPAALTRLTGKIVNPVTHALVGVRPIKHDIGMPDFFDNLVDKKYKDPATGQSKWLCRGPDGEKPRLRLGFTWKSGFFDFAAHQDHRKIHIIDGKIALIGGFAYCTKMRDLMLDNVLEVEGPLAQQLQSTFFLAYTRDKGVLADFGSKCLTAGDPGCRAIPREEIDRALDAYFPGPDASWAGFDQDATLLQNNPYMQGDDLYDAAGHQHRYPKGEKAPAVDDQAPAPGHPETFDPLLAGSTSATQAFHDIVRSATTNIQIINGNITDQVLVHLLVQRYIETDCKLAIDVFNPFNIEVRLYYARPNREALRRLVDGVESAKQQYCGGQGAPVVIRDFVGGEQDVSEECSRWGGMGYIHSKVMVTPTTASLGSTNYDRFSLYRQVEAQVVTHDPKLIEDIHHYVFMEPGSSHCSLPFYDGEPSTLVDISKKVLGSDYTMDFQPPIPLRTTEDTNRFIQKKYHYPSLPPTLFRAFPGEAPVLLAGVQN
jgi:phosphatidylserine/phosphatidylglycerophosphate/cardiolipin synthase-like enzyme